MFLINKRCWHPKYWLLAIVLGMFWLVSRLPYKTQIGLGKVFGRVLYKVSKKIRHVTRSNIRVCFPDLDEVEREEAVRESCRELGISIFETFLVWFRDNDVLFADRVVWEGEEHLQEAVDQGCGIIFLSCHFGCVDINGALLSRIKHDIHLMGTYRDTDPVINDFLFAVRKKFSDMMVSVMDQRTIARQLRKGSGIWYAPDIEIRGKNSVMVDFMGVKASTTIAMSRLAKVSKAIVVPFAHYRESDDPSYRVKVFPALKHFPSDDVEADTRAINAAIEKMIEPYPLRYWWAIKRFKRRPDGEARIY